MYNVRMKKIENRLIGNKKINSKKQGNFFLFIDYLISKKLFKRYYIFSSL